MEYMTNRKQVATNNKHNIHIPGNIKGKLIKLEDKSLAIKIIFILSMSLIATSGLILAFQGIPQKFVLVHLTGYPDSNIPVILIYFVDIMLMFGWTILVIGAFYTCWYIRIPLVFVYIAGTFSTQGYVKINSHDLMADFFLLLEVMLLLVLFCYALFFPLVRGKSLKGSEKKSVLIITTILVSLGALLNYLPPLVQCIFNSTEYQLGQGEGAQLGFFFLLVFPAIILAGTDFAEMGEAVGERFIGVIEPFTKKIRKAVSIFISVIIISIDILLVFIHHSGKGFWKFDSTNFIREVLMIIFVSIIIGSAFAGIGYILNRFLFQKMPNYPYSNAEQFKYWWLYLLTIGIIVSLFFPLFIILLLIVGLYLILAKMQRKDGYELNLFGLLIFLVVPIGVISLGLSISVGFAFEFVFASTTIVLSILYTLGIMKYDTTTIFIRFNVEFLFLSLIIGISEFGGAVGNKISVIQGVLLIGSQLWDLAMSGSQITNGNSKLFPNFSRILMYSGYIVFISLLIAYFSFWQSSVVIGNLGSLFDTDTFARIGILVLGYSLLLVRFFKVLNQRELGQRYNI